MPTADQPAWRAEAEAHKRAMPRQRLLGNGMDYADVAELYERVDAGESWSDVNAQLGERNVARAEAALRAGHTATARSWYLLASACFRVGQVPLADDEPRKRVMYRQLISAYGAAGALTDPPVERIEVPYRQGALCGWLHRPAADESVPVVIVLGGFDGWREEYHVGATYLLERGLAVLLVDGPGQGETRLFHGIHMEHGVEHAFSAVIDHLLADDRVAPSVAIWGNSMGGYLAALTAATDPRITACVVNGGTIRPVETADRYPRFIDKVRLLLGIDDPDKAREVMSTFVLDGELLSALRCSLLVLHGTPDRVFLVENARALFGHAGSSDKTWNEWPDGDHCIYNHSHEKHTLVSDWLADRLKGDRA
ncbi:alpha/beta hydrolase family protein [Nitriliruptor alkaliphilus]|uniref:alpha/beta hydrolase family protein n=1 Tax=Nitriliruptor alkaliphilus TaxID=427918 RepID=UPI0009F87F36|nr:alpha/beta fold hydrolase [Nitriliruptor alkaliphilus]